MDDLILIYTTWESIEQAKKAGEYLLKKRLCGCVNIFPGVIPMFWWPPGVGKINESKEVVMIIKTVKQKYKKVENEIYKIHTFETPCIIAIPVYSVNKDYYDWIKGDIK